MAVWKTLCSDEVKRIILDSFGGAGLPAPFAKVAQIPLRQTGRALSDDASSRWGSLIEACCETVNGLSRLTPHVAASFEMCMAALDVLDEIEDGDSSPLVDEVGFARALNVSTYLLAQSQLILLGLPTSEALPNPSAEFVKTLNRAVLRATAGQDQDLAAERDTRLTSSDALSIARAKSGNLAAGAACLGAMLGTSDHAVLRDVWEFGLHFGTMAQIANDIHDVTDVEGKSDTSRMKATLPLVFSRETKSSFGDPEPSTKDFQSSGALHFAWVCFEIERRRCVEIVETLHDHGLFTNSLTSLLEA